MPRTAQMEAAEQRIHLVSIAKMRLPVHSNGVFVEISRQIVCARAHARKGTSATERERPNETEQQGLILKL